MITQELTGVCLFLICDIVHNLTQQSYKSFSLEASNALKNIMIRYSMPCFMSRAFGYMVPCQSWDDCPNGKNNANIFVLAGAYRVFPDLVCWDQPPHSVGKPYMHSLQSFSHLLFLDSHIFNKRNREVQRTETPDMHDQKFIVPMM